MINKYCQLLFSVLCIINTCIVLAAQISDQPLALSLTISSRTRSLEVAWRNAQIHAGDAVVITTEEPLTFQKPSTGVIESEVVTEGSGGGIEPSSNAFDNNSRFRSDWQCNNSTTSIVHQLIPKNANEWITTTVPFDYALSSEITIDTKCYGFWASYIDSNGTILATGCISAHPKWMNEMRSHIENFRLRDLFIPGTHDSGSYRYRFNPVINETLVTKYSLTQDDDIKGQLMHGIRYLDIRVGYYRSSEELFWANHGISRQRPLREILEQVLDFVEDTNEIVLFDIQEFPVGFGRNLDIHRKLVNFVKSVLGDHIADPQLTWQATLKDIWQRKQTIIVSYDNYEVVDEYPSILFQAIEQRWGNVQNLDSLERFLRRKNQLFANLISRPFADMAELTPDTWGVLTDQYGGLRLLADRVNRFVSKWYENELGVNANIVAVDFYRGTTIVETAISWNLKRIVT